jgi:hypothetical protein
VADEQMTAPESVLAAPTNQKKDLDDLVSLR